MKKVFSVTELNGRIRCLLEESFDYFWIEGEISNLSRPASGHVYFTLKDEKSQIRAVIFRSSVPNKPFLRKGLFFELENGMSVICRARLNVYQPRGEYQLLVDSMEPLGTGALQKAFEQLKARLQAEGLFDTLHKRKLPLLPRRIGVVTSPTGAVIRDILNVTARRFPGVSILIAPVRVQGVGAADEIVCALNALQTHGDVEVIIVARGGGSLEDLAPFNDEGVARAIFACTLPVVSAVGHETDFTIADFVADLRAPTPSAAAELVVPVRMELLAAIGMMRSGIINRQVQILEQLRSEMAFYAERLPSPARRIADLRLDVSGNLNRMQVSTEQKLAGLRRQMEFNALRLRQTNPRRAVGHAREVLERIWTGIARVGAAATEARRKRLAAGMLALEALSPLAVLSRGYGMVREMPGGSILKDTTQLAVGSAVDVTLAQGGFEARVAKLYGSAEGWPRKNLKMP